MLHIDERSIGARRLDDTTAPATAPDEDEDEDEDEEDDTEEGGAAAEAAEEEEGGFCSSAFRLPAVAMACAKAVPFCAELDAGAVVVKATCRFRPTVADDADTDDDIAPPFFCPLVDCCRCCCVCCFLSCCWRSVGALEPVPEPARKCAVLPARSRSMDDPPLPPLMLAPPPLLPPSPPDTWGRRIPVTALARAEVGGN